MARDYNGWETLFDKEFSQDYFVNLKKFLEEEYAKGVIYPPKKLILNAFDQTSPKLVKVVILGQDPYINPNQAMGMSFSVPSGVKAPPSLENIKKEIFADTGKISQIKDGDLTPWANQGVLLLNAVLTVKAGLSNSHKNKGWETFTDSVIKYLDGLNQPVVFLLWGANAKAKRELLTNPNHLVLTSAHPSPLSAYNGFFGCKHFSKTNEFLTKKGVEPIEW
ncbi:MAG: uracil-DNA glycosylase [Clostridia bacterium]|nr:uracil-DNA glycosylase [Clostridia bacterium]